MNELTKTSVQLPDTIEDLTQFVLVGKAKLQAYMLKLQTVNKLSVAQEIRDQTLKEAQEVSTALIAVEQRIGELLLAIPKASGGVNQYNKEEKSTRVEKTKSETISDMGYSKDEASDYQQMAKHPEVVQRVIDDAVRRGSVVTKSQVMKEISALKAELRKAQEKEPEIRTVTKEVYPSDYDDLKQKARLSDAHEKDFQDMRNRYEQMTEKWKKSEREKDALIAEKNDPAAQKTQRLHLNAVSFCAGVSNFLERFGGYTYLMEEINELPDGERKAVFNSLNAVYEWVNDMLGTVAEG